MSVTMADVNGDGKPDLITANQGDGSVTVLLNTTTAGSVMPSFATQTSFYSGQYPDSVTSADLNGDGKPDLIVANSASDGVAVLLNTTNPGASTPTFTSEQTFANVSEPAYGPQDDTASVTTADINGDGRPDLIVVNAYSNNALVLLNTTATGATTPSFATQQTFAVGTNPSSVTATDLNGDGKPDLIVTDVNNTVSVLINTTTAGASTPSFMTEKTFTVGTRPSSVTTADLNGDGLPDLIVSDANDGVIPGHVSVLLNTQHAAFLQTNSVAGTIHYDVHIPVISLSSATLDFGSVAVGAGGAAKTITLTNTGNANLTGLAFSFTGTNASDFSQTNTCAATLPSTPGSNSCTISVIFKPTAASTRSASLQIASDAASSPDSVTLSGAGDAPPVTHGQAITVYAGGTARGQLSAIASNGQALTYATVSQPAHGTLTLTASSGDFTYTPDAGFVGSDNFTFTANDGVATSNIATMTVTVQDPAPIVSSASLTTTANQPVSGTLSATPGYHGQVLTYTVVTPPAHGKVAITASSGSFTYTPVVGFLGTDRFMFVAGDGTVNSNAATVTIKINDVAPVASAGSVRTTAGRAVSGTLSATPGYAGQMISYAIVTQPAHGKLSVNTSSGSFTYAPAVGYVGSDNFTFEAGDGIAVSNAAAVTITVNAAPVQQPTLPVANNLTLTATAGQVVSGQLSATAPSGGTLSYAAIQPAHGKVEVTTSDGKFTYTPTAGYTGTDSFTYTANDGVATSNAATVTINVGAAPTPPPSPPPAPKHGSSGGGAFGLFGLLLLAPLVGFKKRRA